MKKIITILITLFMSSVFAQTKIIFNSGNQITSTDNHYVLLLKGSKKVGKTRLWPVRPYPILSYKVSIPKKDCKDIFSCHSTSFLSLRETHITQHGYTRSAKVDYTIEKFSDGKFGLKIYFENTSGENIEETFFYDETDIIFQ